MQSKYYFIYFDESMCLGVQNPELLKLLNFYDLSSLQNDFYFYLPTFFFLLTIKESLFN